VCVCVCAFVFANRELHVVQHTVQLTPLHTAITHTCNGITNVGREASHSASRHTVQYTVQHTVQHIVQHSVQHTARHTGQHTVQHTRHNTMQHLQRRRGRWMQVVLRGSAGRSTFVSENTGLCSEKIKLLKMKTYDSFHT